MTSSESLLSSLHSKYAEKPWNETLQLVRRCIDKSKGVCKPNTLALNCMEKLHGALNVRSMSSMLSRLETIAKQRGLGSHLSPTETICYLTSDMFYLEVVLLPGGGVQDVKLAQHGEAPESCEALLEILRLNKFEDFSTKLDSLHSLYSIPADNETKIKVYTSLLFLEKDLLKISCLPRLLRDSDIYVDSVLNGRIGHVTPRREGNPMTIEYYLSPYDLLEEKSNTGKSPRGHSALVTVGARESPQRLQMSSLIPQPPQTDVQGLPLCSPLEEVESSVLPACFLLRLHPPLPMLFSFMQKIHQITESAMCETDLEWTSLPHLLMDAVLKERSCSDSWEKGDAHFVFLPEKERHRYTLSGASWGVALLKGSLVHSLPFTHPSHVAAVLELLRHQAALNTLLGSCISCCAPPQDAAFDLHCEVIPESDSSISVSFLHTRGDSLASLFLNVQDSRQLCCKLFAQPGLTDPSIDQYAARVLKRCMSIPVTLSALCRRLPAKRTVTLPATLTSTVTTDETTPDQADEGVPVIQPESVPNTNLSATVSQNAPVVDPAPTPAPPVCSYYVMSAPSGHVDVAADANAEPYPATHVGVFPSWSTTNPLTI